MQQRETSDKKNLRKSYDKANSILPKTLPYITYEEANFIKETFINKYKLRDIALIPYQQEEHAQDWKQQTGDIEFESVNQIVLKQIQNIDSEIIDNNLLIDIYNRLDTDKEC